MKPTIKTQFQAARRAGVPLSMDALLGVGFGDCTVTKDGEQIYSEMAATHESERQGKDLMLWQGKDAEEAAAKDPNHDWRVHFFALRSRVSAARRWPLAANLERHGIRMKLTGASGDSRQ